jgi:hypothetical protein
MNNENVIALCRSFMGKLRVVYWTVFAKVGEFSEV